MEWIMGDYDPGDETLHFGTRAYAETDGCIYEISTVATFQNENQVSDAAPSLPFANISNGRVCVCVGNRLTVFTNASSSSVPCSEFCFDATIDTFTYSPDGNFLFVGLNNSFVHCLRISDEKPVYSKSLPYLPKINGHVFAYMDASFLQDNVLVVSVCGLVYHFENFDLNEIKAATSDALLKDIRANITCSIICCLNMIAPIRSACIVNSRNQTTIFAVGSGLAMYTGFTIDDTLYQYEYRILPVPLVKLQKNDDGMFVALDATGQLFIVSPSTLAMRKLRNRSISDFQLIGDSTSDAMILAVSPIADEDKCNLCMLSLSGLSEKFSLSVGRQCYLMSTKCNVEDIPFLELGIDTASQAVTISLKAATQANPQLTLESLLARKKLDAAESHARNFGLDMSHVHMARARCFLDQMQPQKWNLIHSSEEKRNHLNSLINELHKIKDLDFICDSCVNAVPPDYFVAHSLLEYAQTRLEQCVVNNPELESKVSELSASVHDSMDRLETFNLLKCSWKVEEWLEFGRADLLRDVQIRIKKGNLLEAAIIWSRHESSFKGNLDDEHIVIYLLEEIPAWVRLDDILVWLVHLLPTLLEVQPSSLPNIVIWMLFKISALECSHSTEWPKLGLDYAERMLKLLSSQNTKGALWFLGSDASPLRPLVILRCNLADLYCLRSKYFIFLTLEDFSQPPEYVAITLLQRVEVNLISSFVTEYLNGYALRHKLDFDIIISTFIMLVLQCSGGSWVWEEAPWELRLSTLIPHVTNHKNRLECINAILEAAPCPWSSVISKVAEDGLKLKHPMSSLIREKQKQISINVLLKKYGLNAHINKIDRKKLLKRIVGQNDSDMLSDIAEISQRSVDDYVTVIQRLCLLGNASKALEVLRKLPDDLKIEVCPQIICGLTQSLDYCEVSSVKEDVEFISAVAECHDRARASNPPGVSKIDDLNDSRVLLLSPKEIKNRFCLKRDFKKYLTVKEMSVLQCREKALKEVVQDLLIEVVENEKPQERSIRVYHKASYAARLLFLSTAFSITEIIEQAMDLSDYELATYTVGYCHDAENLSSKTVQRLSRLPTLLVSKVQFLDSKDGDTELLQNAASDIYRVLSKVVCYCDIEHARSTNEELGWSRVWDFVSGQQELSLLGQRDPLLSWRFTPLYKDPGLAGFMSGSHLHKFLCNAFSFISSLDDQEFLSELTQSITKLQNEQHDVAVVMILCQLSSAMQNSSKMEFSLPLHETFLNSCEVLLTKVCGSRHFDRYLGLGLLSCMGQTVALKYLQQVCKSQHMDFQRQKSLSSLGTIVSDLWGMPELHSQFKLISLQSTWGLRLSELGIPAEAWLCAPSDTDFLLKKLIGSKKVSAHLLQALCTDYQLDFQAILLKYLRAVLTLWDPDPIIRFHPDGTKDFILQNTYQQLLDQCWKIQELIKDKNSLCTTLQATWASVNFYHHEVFIVILDILEHHGVEEQINKRPIITFLKNYRRIKPPNEVEEEFWSKVFPTFNFPPMSDFRLPYNQLLNDDPLFVVRPEIYLNTYKKWLRVAACLALPKDTICALAVRHTVKEEFSSFQSLKNKALFESIATCVEAMDSADQAATTLYQLMDKIPAGLDPGDVAKLCLEYAEIALKQNGDTKIKLKVEKKFINLATLQALHMNGLGQPSYLQLARNPTELITALYKHPTILELARGTSSHSPDINALVQEICGFHSIDVKSLLENLVSMWLQPDILENCDSSMEDDCFRNTNHNYIKKSDFSDHYCSDENILRARYIMEQGELKDWANFLIRTAYQSDACTGMRLRAMMCLCALKKDDESLENLAGRSISEIRKKLHTLAYLRDLEILGLTYSESRFDSCDKKELANLILRTQSHNRQALSLLVRLCVEFDISHKTLWNSIFQQLIFQQTMMKELEQALTHTSKMYQLRTVPFYSKAWDLLLTSPFLNGNSNPDGEQKSAMLHAVTLLPTCPVLKHVKVLEALDHCLANQMPDMAALLLPYIDNTLIPHWKEKILTTRKANNLIADLQKIASEKCINILKILNMLSF